VKNNASIANAYKGLEGKHPNKFKINVMAIEYTVLDEKSDREQTENKLYNFRQEHSGRAWPVQQNNDQFL